MAIAVLSSSAAASGCGHPTDDDLRVDVVRRHPVDPPPDEHELFDPRLAALLGEWASANTGRSLHAVRGKDGRSVEFQVVDAREFDGAYAARETRFVVRPGSGKTYLIEDLYRPLPPELSTYSPASYASCLAVFTRDEAGHALTASLVGPGRFRVKFALTKTSIDVPHTIWVSGMPPREIKGCAIKLVASTEMDFVRRTP